MATAAKQAVKPASKTRAAKPAPKPAAAELQQLAPTALTTVAYGRLKRAPQNVRKTDIAADVESLAEDIAAHGLLQSLIGYVGTTKIDAQAVYVVGGGRRLQALQLLHERSVIDDQWPVPVLIRPEEEAIELSLSENLARRDMNPADEFIAFAALMAPGTKSPADLAKQFGFTERYVKQRLKLASLDEVILDALREGKLTIDAAMAYASTSDRTVQREVFKRQSKQRGGEHSATGIRWAINNDTKTESWPLFKFVGAKAYEREGGGYEEGLFDLKDTGKNGRRLDNAFVVVSQAHQMIDFQMLRLTREWAEELDLGEQITGFVKVKDLEFGDYHMAYHAIEKQAPNGYAWVGNDYNPARVERMLKTIRNNRILVQLPVGINSKGELIRIPKGFFVPKDQARAVDPPENSQPTYRQPTQEEVDAQRRKDGIARFAWRKGVGSFAGTPLEGRAFWPIGSYPGFVDDLPRNYSKEQFPEEGKLVTVQIYVTDAQMKAAWDEAEKAYDQELVEREAQRAAKEAAAAEEKAAMQAKWDELCALDPAPEVLLDERGNLWVKTDQGWTIEGQEDDVGYAETFADLLEEFGPGDITEWWPTRVSYDQAHPVGAPDEEG